MASDKIITLTDDNFDAEVVRSSVPILVDFWAEWCGPCRMITPVLEKVATEVAGSAKIGKVNIDENPGLTSQFGITSIPTLMIFSGGQVKDTLMGAGHSPDEIKRRLIG